MMISSPPTGEAPEAQEALMDRIAYARAAFAELANDDLLATVEQLLADRKAEWRVDPEVAGVFGLCSVGSSNEALVLVYAPSPSTGSRWDFEHNYQLDALLTK